MFKAVQNELAERQENIKKVCWHKYDNTKTGVWEMRWSNEKKTIPLN